MNLLFKEIKIRYNMIFNQKNTNIVVYFLFSFLIFSCSNDNTLSEKELALKEKELELRERELELEKSSAEEPNVEKKDLPQTINNKTLKLKPREKTIGEIQDELYSKEIKNPLDYLSVDYSLTYKILTGEDKITGKIYNSATLASFKDVVLTVTYSTATGTQLGSKDYIVYDYVDAGGSTPFTIKTYSPEGTRSIGVQIKSAKSD